MAGLSMCVAGARPAASLERQQMPEWCGVDRDCDGFRADKEWQ